MSCPSTIAANGRALLTRIRWQLLLFLLVAAWLVGCGREHDSKPENVVLILVDTLRQDRLGGYGYSEETSPVLDRLMEEGARLDCVSPTSWTKPATASLLTGLHPLRHQTLAAEDRLPSKVRTLAEELGDRGFQTAAVSGNAWVSPAMGFDQGFDSLELIQDDAYPHGPDGERVNASVRKVLDKLEPPFFLYVHYIDPHSPYQPPELLDGSPVQGDLAKLAKMTSLPNFFKGPPPPAHLESALRSLYDGEVRSVDRAIGDVLAMIDERGWSDSTLTVVTSDHGEEFLEHARVGHGRTLYREVIRVPLILHGPGVTAGGSIATTVNLLDVFPTIMGLLGFDLEKDHVLDGFDLGPDLRGEDSLQPSARSHLLVLDSARDGLSLVGEERKLLLTGEPYRKALFDLRNDALEQDDLSSEEGAGESFRELGVELAARYNKIRKEALRREISQADGSTDEQLAALGYLANTRKKTPRKIPGHIRPTDEFANGLLGWENLGRLASCVRPHEPRSLRLQGWLRKEDGGIWSGPEASIVVLADGPSSRRSLVLEARAGATGRIRLALGGMEIYKGETLAGEGVHLEIPVPEDLPEGPAVLVMSTEGERSSDAEPWQSGLLVFEVCLDAIGY